MNSVQDVGSSPTGFPIRIPPDQRSLSTSPKFFAASHVLHRLCAPRHSPSALSSLTITYWSRSGFEDQPLRPALFSPLVCITILAISGGCAHRARLPTISVSGASRNDSLKLNLNQ